MAPNHRRNLREKICHARSPVNCCRKRQKPRIPWPQILRFLSDTRAAAGDAFSLRRFHDELWTNGNVPIALQEWEYLGRR